MTPSKSPTAHAPLLSLREELRRLGALALPIVVAQFALIGLGMVDTLMIGHVSVEALDAVALGQLWTWATAMLPLGCVMGLDSEVAQAHGAGNPVAGGRALQRGLSLATLSGIALVGVWLTAGPALELLGQKPALATEAGMYMRSQAWSAPFAPLYVALNQYLLSRGITWPGLSVAVAANLLNAALNAVLIFGSPFNEPMGVYGAALATGTTRVLLFAGLVGLVAYSGILRDAWPSGRVAEVLRPAELYRLFALGLPVGLQYTLEVWAFQAGTLMAGRFGEVPLAAHAVVLNLIFMTFTVPFGISMAVAMRVGNLLGAGHHRQAQRAAWTALAAALLVALCSAALFASAPRWLAGLYTEIPAVIETTVPLFLLAGAFQVFDATQAVGGAVLRGMGRPRPVVFFNLLGYFAVGLPLAYWLAFVLELGVVGIWYGYCAGLSLVAAALVTWIAQRGPRTLAAA